MTTRFESNVNQCVDRCERYVEDHSEDHVKNHTVPHLFDVFFRLKRIVYLFLHKCRFEPRSLRLSTMAVASAGPRNPANVFSGMLSPRVENICCRAYAERLASRDLFREFLPTRHDHCAHLGFNFSRIFRADYVCLVHPLNLLSGLYSLNISPRKTR